MQKGICFAQKQSEFDLEKAISESAKYNGFATSDNRNTNWENLFLLFN